MENKSAKIFAVLLGFLFVVFVAAAYILLHQGTKTTVSETRTQTENIKQPHPVVPPKRPSAMPTADQASPPPKQSPKQASIRDNKPLAHNTKQIPRRLTGEQKEENRRELVNMADALPDNMWVPKEPAVGGYNPEQGEKLRKSIELSDKIRKGSASAEEQKNYYSYKLKETRDKIELIRYIAQRTKELAEKNGKEYLSNSDIVTGERRIEQLEELAGEYQQKLDEIASDSSD